MRTSPFRAREPITAEDAARLDVFAERPSVIARQASLSEARRQHVTWLRSIGVTPPTPPVIVPEARSPSRQWVVKRRGRRAKA